MKDLMMDAKDLDYYKNKLLQKQASLMDMVHRTEGYGREKEQNIQDIGDMAVESYTKEFMFGKSSGDRQILQLVGEALKRIEDKTYGLCVHCENPIQPKRLEAVPWASHCIQCQELKEKGLLD
jgi:DnaK suppressor protein